MEQGSCEKTVMAITVDEGMSMMSSWQSKNKVKDL